MPLWTNYYQGAVGYSVANAVAVEGGGNVLVTGYSATDYPNFEDYATIKYSSAGVPLWTNRYWAENYRDLALALAVDGSGNLFVTGSSYITNAIYSYATVAYSSAGVPLWTNCYGGEPGNQFARAFDVAVDGSGNLFVTGYSLALGRPPSVRWTWTRPSQRDEHHLAINRQSSRP